MKKYLYAIGFASIILLIISLASLAFADSLIIPSIVEANPESYTETIYKNSLGRVASYHSNSPDLPDIDIYLIKVSTDLEAYVASDMLIKDPTPYAFITKTGNLGYQYYEESSHTTNIVYGLSRSLIEKICIHTPS